MLEDLIRRLYGLFGPLFCDAQIAQADEFVRQALFIFDRLLPSVRRFRGHGG